MTTALIERRDVALSLSDLEVRSEGNTVTFTGHASVFNVWSEDLGGWREKVLPGAFGADVIGPGIDIPMLFNHNPDIVLASTRSGMTLAEDDRGLAVSTPLNMKRTQVAEVASMIRDGDVRQMSIGFQVAEATWNDNFTERVVAKFRKLWDVSPVVYPAFPQTDANVRAVMHALAIGSLEDLPLEEQRAIALELREGKVLSSKNLERIQSAIETLQAVVTDASSQSSLPAAMRLRRDRLEAKKRAVA